MLNADDYKAAAEREASLRREVEELRRVGLEPEEVGLRDYFRNSAVLREALAGFDTVSVRGGNVFILRRALRQSGADELIKELLASDAVVYAGYSAGPCMPGPTLRGIGGFEDGPGVVASG